VFLFIVVIVVQLEYVVFFRVFRPDCIHAGGIDAWKLATGHFHSGMFFNVSVWSSGYAASNTCTCTGFGSCAKRPARHVAAAGHPPLLLPAGAANGRLDRLVCNVFMPAERANASGSVGAKNPLVKLCMKSFVMNFHLRRTEQEK